MRRPSGPRRSPASEQCSLYFFSVSWEGEQQRRRPANISTRRGVKTLFVTDPNYAAGKDVAAGVKGNFKGQVVGELYTAWPGQLDFSAELTKPSPRSPMPFFASRRGGAVPDSICVGAEWPDSALRGLDDRRAVAAENRELALNAINEKFVSGFRAAYKRDGQPETSPRLTVGGLCGPASHSRRPNPPDANRKTIPDRHRTKRKAARQHPIRVQPSRPATSLVLDW